VEQSTNVDALNEARRIAANIAKLPDVTFN
jgi:hypothetical protein